MGGKLIIVEAIDEPAVRFYMHHGFKPTPTAQCLYLKASDAAASPIVDEVSGAQGFEALTATAAACAGVDTFEPLAHLIEGWRATAEIHANPELAKVLSVPRSGPPVKIKRPKAS